MFFFAFVFYVIFLSFVVSFSSLFLLLCFLLEVLGCFKDLSCCIKEFFFVRLFRVLFFVIT
ncbi:hypothetical protein C530_115 [Candidatus Portiera aleyrodidarum BT-B-HRs]|nr:hypothetical protein C530_115 [Candidatus Portiera aleyrodidarum BT-B-HRs]ASX27114.1 hypothetical protein BA172_00125 [Candidatus Portiera aleyrodidarum MED (Bemisia tabaci)]